MSDPVGPYRDRTTARRHTGWLRHVGIAAELGEHPDGSEGWTIWVPDGALADAAAALARARTLPWRDVAWTCVECDSANPSSAVECAGCGRHLVDAEPRDPGGREGPVFLELAADEVVVDHCFRRSEARRRAGWLRLTAIDASVRKLEHGPWALVVPREERDEALAVLGPVRESPDRDVLWKCPGCRRRLPSGLLRCPRCKRGLSDAEPTEPPEPPKPRYGKPMIGDSALPPLVRLKELLIVVVLFLILPHAVEWGLVSAGVPLTLPEVFGLQIWSCVALVVLVRLGRRDRLAFPRIPLTKRRALVILLTGVGIAIGQRYLVSHIPVVGWQTAVLDREIAIVSLGPWNGWFLLGLGPFALAGEELLHRRYLIERFASFGTRAFGLAASLILTSCVGAGSLLEVGVGLWLCWLPAIAYLLLRDIRPLVLGAIIGLFHPFWRLLDPFM